MKRLIGLALATAIAMCVALPAASAAAATRCPATFQVLHNDRIGAMVLPAGPYYVTVSRLSCASASRLFARFLQDYDGNLPYPWRANAKRRLFTNGRSSFRVTPANRTPSRRTATTCPGTFSVLHNDRIGSVRLPKGRYTLRTLRGMSCSAAASQFATFLDMPRGVPAPWTISGSTGKALFQNNMAGTSFSATRTSGGGGGGRTGVSCGPFRVLHNDHIGSLYVPKGSHDIVIPPGSTMTCTRATKALIRFLDAEALPRPWVLDVSTGTFRRGSRSRIEFRLDPVAGTIR